ncbi:hypothetical protein SYNPS1DRAFT_30245 [Syncephalis pseudoplumigaleata]|uniref:Uncharacterized protein n=1 Tax=Syncephalis pseudoplumigaleata TaxID=1712513 RepID=A0A4P9YVY1_9FUNG|nr:hypothetical protein SYNPS1DRAFT_30245 [Syncephalis pseudoplumigaleata]|eukprot:RKP23985.1 hypothetical protein SYNPS1DRAFT_30245 [Syncephalis pseudoplumigaleata]
MADTKAQIQRPPAKGAVTIAEIDLEMVALHDDRDDNIARYAAVGAGPAQWRHCKEGRDPTHADGQCRTCRRGIDAAAATTSHRYRGGGIFIELAGDACLDAAGGFAVTMQCTLRDAPTKRSLQRNGGRVHEAHWHYWLGAVAASLAGSGHVGRGTAAWHPYKQIMGIVHRDDMVFVYNVSEQEWFPDPLHHPLQQDAVQLAWRPNAAGALAVVCRHGLNLIGCHISSGGRSGRCIAAHMARGHGDSRAIATRRLWHHTPAVESRRAVFVHWTTSGRCPTRMGNKDVDGRACGGTILGCYGGGYIRGPPAPGYEPGDILDVARPPHAATLAFAQQFDRGSLLAVAWDNGKITFVPFFYLANNRPAHPLDHRSEEQQQQRSSICDAPRSGELARLCSIDGWMDVML